MLYRFLKSKKGFTLIELMVVVVVLGILTAVAVPILSTGYKKQQKDDCRNQCLVIETAVKQAMFGMIDNGKKQEEITFMCTTVADGVVGDSVSVADPTYGPGGKSCFVLTYPRAESNAEQKQPYVSGARVFSLADIRGGYRTAGIEDYREGCKSGYYLKKLRLQYSVDEDGNIVGPVPFYTYLDNQEIPICPFANYKDNDLTNNYYYYVLKDGSVHCSCPECG